jgi:hypothetical protein
LHFLSSPSERPTPEELNKLLGYASSNVGDCNYLLSIISVDVQTAFREEKSTGHIAKLQSVSTSETQVFHRHYPQK